MSYPPLSIEVAQFMILTNREREVHGLPMLQGSRPLANAAQAYAEELERWGQLSHTGPDGSSCLDRAQRAGYGDGQQSFYVGENLCHSQSGNAADVLRCLMGSPGHRDNILRAEFKEIGTGRSGDYWVQLFGG